MDGFCALSALLRIRCVTADVSENDGAATPSMPLHTLLARSNEMVL
jgi:hypothetical protein